VATENRQVHSSRTEDWKPARKFPETYPGDCPGHSYVILDEMVHPLEFDRPGDLDSAVALVDGKSLPLDRILEDRGLPPLADRHPSLGYGANRNPGTLAIKMRNYGYAGETSGLVLPVLKGSARGTDVVACGLSGQGYLYADMMLQAHEEEDRTIEAWLPLLDPDQVRVMHDGESVRSGLYGVAEFPFRLDGFRREFHALGYAGNDHAFISPVLGAPLTYTTVRVANRGLPEMTPVEMMEHVLEIGGLAKKFGGLIGFTDGESFALHLMKFMNERWWIGFRGGEQPDDRYDEIVSDCVAVIEQNQSPRTTAAIMEEAGRMLTIDEAYEPGAARTLGAVLAE